MTTMPSILDRIHLPTWNADKCYFEFAEVQNDEDYAAITANVLGNATVVLVGCVALAILVSIATFFAKISLVLGIGFVVAVGAAFLIALGTEELFDEHHHQAPPADLRSVGEPDPLSNPFNAAQRREIAESAAEYAYIIQHRASTQSLSVHPDGASAPPAPSEPFAFDLYPKIEEIASTPPNPSAPQNPIKTLDLNAIKELPESLRADAIADFLRQSGQLGKDALDAAVARILSNLNQ